MLRKAAIADVRRRFARLILAIDTLLVKEDSFGLSRRREGPRSPFATNERWELKSSPEQLAAFQEWLRKQLKWYVVGMTEDQLWARYVQEGFRKGAGRAFDDLRSKRGPTFRSDDFAQGQRQQFLATSFRRPETVEKVKILASRTFEELTNVGEEIRLKLGRVLTDGLARGDNPRVVAREMTKQLAIPQRRAETIARTEIIRAHAEGQLSAMEDLGVDEVGVMVEWSTAGDDRVCEACAPMEGVVLKLEEAHGMIPRHPNCRCSFIPANVGESRKEQVRGKTRIERQIDLSARLAGDTFDVGIEIDKSRPRALVSPTKNVENAFCPTGPGGGVDPTCSPRGGGGGSGSGAKFASMPLTKATAKESKKWIKDNQTHYDNDPEFRAVADSVALYTQGDYSVQRAFAERAVTGELPEHYKDSALPNWVDQGMHPNALSEYKTYFAGQEWMKSGDTHGQSKATYAEAGAALVNAVADSPPLATSLYRGVAGGKALLEAETLKPGDDFNVIAPLSFTADKDIGDQFSRGVAKGQGRGRRSESDFSVTFEVLPGARGLPVSALSPWDQKEVLTSGKFKVRDVDKTDRDRIVVKLEQVDVYRPKKITTNAETGEFYESELSKMLSRSQMPFDDDEDEEQSMR